MRKKILFILHLPPPVNGASMVGQYIKESANINKEFDTDYINLATSFDLQDIGKGGYKKLVVSLKILKNVYKTLRKNEYDLCYLTLTAKGIGFYKDFLVVLVIKLFGVKILYHFHNKGVAQNSKNGLNHLLYKMAFKNTQSVLLSQTLYTDIQRYVAAKDIYVCPNGVESLQTAVHVERPMNRDRVILLFLSNMMEEKGVYYLLEACGILKQKGLNFECHFIGEWADITQTDFKQIVYNLNLEANCFEHGKKYGREKATFFKEADIFILPTYYHNECFPLVLLEAMQFGLAVVSTNEGAIPDIVMEGKTGFLVKKKSAKALAEALNKLILNVELRTQFGKEGRKRFEKLYTMNIFQDTMNTILLNATRN